MVSEEVAAKDGDAIGTNEFPCGLEGVDGDVSGIPTSNVERLAIR